MFFWPVRVYYEDTDSGGVVYHANYLKFMERARTEWLRSLGFEQDELARHPGVIFAVQRMELEFLYPARFNALLQVSVALRERRAASLLFQQEIVTAGSATGTEAGDARGHQRGGKGENMDGDTASRVLCRARVRIACLDATSLRPRRIPVPLQREIAREC